MKTAPNLERLRARLSRTLTIEPFTPDRAEALRRFFEDAYADQPITAFHDPEGIRRHWQWANQHEPSAWICLKQGRIVGHFASSGAVAVVEAEPTPVRWGRHLIVAADQRRAGVGPLLIVSAIEATSTPFFIAGLNEDIYPVYQRLGFVDLGRIPLYVKAYQPNLLLDTLPWPWAVRRSVGAIVRGRQWIPARLKRNTGLTAVTLEQFDDRFDAWWTEVEPAFPCVVRRTSATLTWRYRCHPFHRYTVLAARSGGDLRGIAVFRHGRSRGLPAGFITEILTHPRDLEAALFLLVEAGRALLASAEERPVFLRCAMHHARLERILWRGGFVRAPSPLHWMVAGVTHHPHGEQLARRENWFLNTGDSDLEAI